MAIKVPDFAKDNLLRIIIVADEIYITTLTFEPLIKQYFSEQKSLRSSLLKSARYIVKEAEKYVRRLELYHKDDVFMATAIMNAQKKGRRQLDALYNNALKAFKNTRAEELLARVATVGYLAVALVDFTEGMAVEYKRRGYPEEYDLLRGFINVRLANLMMSFANDIVANAELNLTPKVWDDMAVRCVKYLNEILLPEKFDKIKAKSEKEAEVLR